MRLYRYAPVVDAVFWSGAPTDTLVSFLSRRRLVRAGGYREGSAGSARACEQLLKSLLHAFGIHGRVRQGVAIRSGADRQSSVVAGYHMDKVQSGHQGAETGDAYKSGTAEEERFGWTWHIGHGRVRERWARERKHARGLCSHPEQRGWHYPNQLEQLGPGRSIRPRTTRRGRFSDQGEPFERISDVGTERLQPAEQHVPVAGLIAPSRSEIGHAATSDSSGNSSWPSRYSRRAPPTYASATSLTVEPGTLALIRLKSARSWNRASKTRCGDTVWLKRVFGGNDGTLPPTTLDATPLTSLPGRPAKPRTTLGALEASTRPARNG